MTSTTRNSASRCATRRGRKDSLLCRSRRESVRSKRCARRANRRRRARRPRSWMSIRVRSRPPCERTPTRASSTDTPTGPPGTFTVSTAGPASAGCSPIGIGAEATCAATRPAAPPCSCPDAALGAEPALEIRAEIPRRFQADRDPQQPLGHPGAGPCLRRDPPVGGGGGVGNGGLGVAEVRRNGYQARRVDHLPRGLAASFDLERHDGAARALLLRGEPVLRVRRQSRVENLADAGMGLQPARELKRALRLRFHPYPQSLE